MLRVTCHMSHVTFLLLSFFSNKLVELVGGGSLITLSSLFRYNSTVINTLKHIGKSFLMANFDLLDIILVYYRVRIFLLTVFSLQPSNFAHRVSVNLVSQLPGCCQKIE